jgi:hypothetical protein
MTCRWSQRNASLVSHVWSQLQEWLISGGYRSHNFRRPASAWVSMLLKSSASPSAREYPIKTPSPNRQEGVR